jgi:hypothetical protein
MLFGTINLVSKASHFELPTKQKLMNLWSDSISITLSQDKANE